MKRFGGPAASDCGNSARRSKPGERPLTLLVIECFPKNKEVGTMFGNDIAHLSNAEVKPLSPIT
jgi:hypothetical protein